MADKNGLSDAQAVEALVKIIKDRDAGAPAAKAEKGVCIFTAAGHTSCLNMTKAECGLVDGTWSSDGKCATDYPASGTCKAK